MTAEQLASLLSAINYGNLFHVVGVFLIGLLCLIELIRLIIVIKRSVKGRMDRVPADR